MRKSSGTGVWDPQVPLGMDAQHSGLRVPFRTHRELLSNWSPGPPLPLEGARAGRRERARVRGADRRGQHVTSCFFKGTWLFPAAPVLASASPLRRPELESDPERSVAMDSALSDPHNGSAEGGGAANGTTRPPSTPEGIALAYGSLLLMALLPIFFGALRSVRCARGKVGSEAKPRALSISHLGHA